MNELELAQQKLIECLKKEIDCYKRLVESQNDQINCLKTENKLLNLFYSKWRLPHE